MTRVFIVDDHEMYLEGLSLLLAKQPTLQVVGTCQLANQLLQQLPNLSTEDILLLDVNLPDMEEDVLLREIRKIRPEQNLVPDIDAGNAVCSPFIQIPYTGLYTEKCFN